MATEWAPGWEAAHFFLDSSQFNISGINLKHLFSFGSKVKLESGVQTENQHRLICDQCEHPRGSIRGSFSPLITSLIFHKRLRFLYTCLRDLFRGKIEKTRGAQNNPLEITSVSSGFSYNLEIK